MPQNAIYPYNIGCDTIPMSQVLSQSRHPEPAKILVERSPVKEGVKLSESLAGSWEDLRGLSWLFVEDWS
jgi:hypothetical protein